jgi:hypothetical protein
VRVHKSALANGSVAISLPFPSASPRPAFNFAFVNGITNSSQLIGACDTGATSLTLEALSTTGGRPSAILGANCPANGEIQVTGACRWQ